MLRFQSHTCRLSSVAGFVRRRVPLHVPHSGGRPGCAVHSVFDRRACRSCLLVDINIKGCGHSFLPSGETNNSRTAPLYPVSARPTRECAASACSCKGLQKEKPLPSHSLTESPNHTDYKLRPDSFMAGGISRKAIAGQRSRAQRICLLFSPVNRIPLRHFVQFFHNHFRLVVRPERPGDIHVATGLVFVLPGVPCLPPQQLSHSRTGRHPGSPEPTGTVKGGESGVSPVLFPLIKFGRKEINFRLVPFL